MASVGNLAAYSQDLLSLLAFRQNSGSRGSVANAGISPDQPPTNATPADGKSSTGALGSVQSPNFTLTPVIFTTNPITGGAIATQFEVYNGTSSLPSVRLSADQLKALQEVPAAPPQLPSVNFSNARELLESADSNNDGTISQSELESIAVSSGSNVQQADALFKSLTPNGGNAININQILETL